MHIVLISSSLRLGGAERVLSTLANAWAEKGYQVTMLLYANQDHKPFFSLHQNIAVKTLNCTEESRNLLHFLKNLGKKFYRIRTEIKRLKPDVIISFSTETNILAILATRFLAGCYLIVCERSNPLKYPKSNLYKKLRTLSYPFAEQVVLQTEASKICFKHIKQLTVIPNPIKQFAIDPNFSINSHFSFDPDFSFDPKFSFSLKKPYIIAVGRLSDEKGFEDIIAAFAKIAEKYSEWSLVILGDGPKESALIEQIKLLNLTSRIHLLGALTEPENVMKDAELFVLTSRFEGFPNALCEAMALGLPSISYDCQFGPNDIIQNNKNGILVPPNDVAKLTAAIKTLIDNPIQRQQFGETAKEINQRLSLPNILAQWDKLFKLRPHENGRTME